MGLAVMESCDNIRSFMLIYWLIKCELLNFYVPGFTAVLVTLGGLRKISYRIVELFDIPASRY